MPGDVKNICTVVKDVICFLNTVYGEPDECVLFELKVILNELVSNAIKHGIEENADRYVRLAAGVTKNEQLLLMVEDDGQGYDYGKVLKNGDEHLFADLCDMKENGRGLLIVRNLCDKIKFNEKGNRVVVLKKLHKS